MSGSCARAISTDYDVVSGLFLRVLCPYSRLVNFNGQAARMDRLPNMKSSGNSLDNDGENQSASSAKNDREESKLSKIEKFRRVASSVGSQGGWTKALQTKIADEHSSQISGQTDVSLSFNANGEHIFMFYSKSYILRGVIHGFCDS